MKANIFLILLIVIIGVIFSGCEKQDDKTDLYLSENEIEFNYDENSATIYVNNIGSGEFSWNVSSEDDYIYFSKSSGNCSKNIADKFEIKLQRNKIIEDSISTSIMFSTSTGENQEISLFILNFPEHKIRLSFKVFDVGYDYINDRIIFLSDNNIEVYDLEENIFQSIELNQSHSSLSVSPDGSYAVAGGTYSNSNISYINLAESTLIGEFAISNDINDIVFAPDNISYIFPNYSNNSIGKLNLINGNYSIYQFNQIGDDINAKLHPSGHYIYAAGEYLGLIKFDIQSDVPEMIYNSSYYDLDNKLWLSKDGNKIFTITKKVFHIDPSLPGEDVTDVSELTFADNYLYSIEQSSLLDKYYLITTNNSYSSLSESNMILVFNSSLTLENTINLENFYYLQQSQNGYLQVNASAEYVFSSKDGSKIIVICKSDYGYNDSWGIEIIENSKKP
ncbi:MAG: hypothetical protein K8R41_00850 [Bacteroidales bacterium]|nr:hypothetical protein [Bacteroidales bacterium]